MRGHRAVVHDVGKKQQRVVFRINTHNLTPNHLYPFIEDLLQVVWCDGRADNLARLDGCFYGGNELVFMGSNFERNEVRTNVG